MKKYMRGSLVYIVIFLVILVLVSFLSGGRSEVKEFQISEVVHRLNNDEIKTIKLKNNSLDGELKDGTKFKSYTPAPLSNVMGVQLYQKILDDKILVKGEAPEGRSIIFELLPMILTIGIFAVFWFVFMNNSQGGGKVMGFGKSKAKLRKDTDKKITFKDVAGLKEEKEELEEVVDFLKTPGKYTKLGARIPKGILMVGPPGTGKTYLSKAVSGEAGVPFFSISGSDFVEMFVGVGASRVRDMFTEAKKNSPCIIFIDEIDAVGRKRGAGLGGGHDEREQTLNQLLVEMDGFGENENVIIMAATNRPDILDPALLRPGRFDRQIMVGRPDIVEREQMLKIHARNKPMAKNVNFKVIARGTPGFTPADLENVLNEAAIISARKDQKLIDMKSIEEATTKMIAGVEKKTRVMDEKEKRLTAYHEGGHAVLAKLIENGDPVHQVTIIPRGMAGGFTMQLPEGDRNYESKKHLLGELIVLLGGRLGEKLVIGDISTGASNDLERVTKIARDMVTKYAMSDNLSQMAYETGEEVFIGRDMGHMKNNSEQVLAEIDREISKLVDDAYQKAETLLVENIDALHRVAEALMEYETINGEEFEAAFIKGAAGVKEIRDKNDGEMGSSIFVMTDEEKAEFEVSDSEVDNEKIGTKKSNHTIDDELDIENIQGDVSVRLDDTTAYVDGKIREVKDSIEDIIKKDDEI